MSDATASDVITPEQLALISLISSNTHLEQELELMKFKYKKLQQTVYGKKSEKQFLDSSEQLNIFGNEESPAPETEDSDEYESINYKRKKKSSKKYFPEDLPVDEVVFTPTERNCTDCGAELKEFSRDIREDIEFKPARFFRRQIVKVNCSCPKCKKVVSGKTPSPVIPGSQLGASFFAHLITSRFSDHLPYYRQSQIYQREGVIIPDKSLSNYAQILGSLLQPVAKGIKESLLSLDYLQADETRLEVLEKEKTHRGQLWVLNDPRSNLSYYEYHDSRSQVASDSFLNNYSGALQTDGYVTYGNHQGVSLACLAHARRYFVKASKLAPKDAKHIVKLISKLYGIEKELTKRRIRLKPEEWYQERLKVRQKDSVPILDNLKKYLIRIKDQYLVDDHPMTKAINYMLSRYELFSNYTTNGRYQIDNNDIERVIRPIAIGRKNWLFAGSHEAAKINAVMMTIMETCKQMKVNPQRYLESVLPKLADHKTTSLDGLTPMDWKDS